MFTSIKRQQAQLRIVLELIYITCQSLQKWCQAGESGLWAVRTDSEVKALFDWKVSANCEHLLSLHGEKTCYWYSISCSIQMREFQFCCWSGKYVNNVFHFFQITIQCCKNMFCSGWTPGSRDLSPRVHQGLLSGQPVSNLLCQVPQNVRGETFLHIFSCCIFNI